MENPRMRTAPSRFSRENSDNGTLANAPGNYESLNVGRVSPSSNGVAFRSSQWPKTYTKAMDPRLAAGPGLDQVLKKLMEHIVWVYHSLLAGKRACLSACCL